jgi:hypothetical protein
MATLSSSLTNLAVLLLQSHDYYYYVRRRMLEPPPLCRNAVISLTLLALEAGDFVELIFL